MSIRPLMDTRPSGVSLEQIVLWVKCDSGEVCGTHDERQVVEGRAEAGLPVYPGADPAHPRAERLEQQREGPVELVAEAAAATAHDLVDQVGLVQRDRFGQVNAQVLERHGQLVRPVQCAQARRVTDGWRGDADPVQVRHHGLVIHRILSEAAGQPKVNE
jgi:hypothetical protein